jgi:hypothetical protein
LNQTEWRRGVGRILVAAAFFVERNMTNRPTLPNPHRPTRAQLIVFAGGGQSESHIPPARMQLVTLASEAAHYLNVTHVWANSPRGLSAPEQRQRFKAEADLAKHLAALGYAEGAAPLSGVVPEAEARR